MNFFDFLMAMSRNNPGGMSYGRDPRSTRVSFPIQQAGMADTGFMSTLAPWISRFGPATPGSGGQARNAAQQGLVGGQMPGIQFNGGGGGVSDIPGAPFQAAPVPTGPPLVGGPLPGIQYNAPPPQTSTRNTRAAPSTPTSTASSRNSNAVGGGSGSTYNNLLGQGYQPVSFGGG